MAKKSKVENTAIPTTVVNARFEEFEIGVFDGSEYPQLWKNTDNINQYQDRILDCVAFQPGFVEFLFSLRGKVLGCRCDHGHTLGCHAVILIRIIDHPDMNDPKEFRSRIQLSRKTQLHTLHPIYMRSAVAWKNPIPIPEAPRLATPTVNDLPV